MSVMTVMTVTAGISAQRITHGVASGLSEGWWMFYATFWALVLGFALSGAVQAFVSRSQMRTALGDHRPTTLARASFLGGGSSSYKYAASALAKSLFARGADFTASMVFMIASTNLVVELGVVLWLLLGWQFAAAEFVGGAIMIVLLGIALPRAIPGRWIDEARDRLARDREPSADAAAPGPWQQRMRTRAGWSQASGYTISDLTMLRKELVAGFLVAGFASALWRGGISFGGVIAFVFADLITLPLLVIYRKYFGTRLTLRLLGAFWVTMSVAGLLTEYLFKAVR